MSDENISDTECPRCGCDDGEDLSEAEDGEIVCGDCRASIHHYIDQQNNDDGPLSILERYEQIHNARF